MIEIEPTELKDFDKFIEKSDTFSRYKSKIGSLESSHFMDQEDEVFSAHCFNQMGHIDVFVTHMETNTTGMSGSHGNRPRNEMEQKCDFWADIILKKIVNESKQLYMESYKK